MYIHIMQRIPPRRPPSAGIQVRSAVVRPPHSQQVGIRPPQVAIPRSIERSRK